MEIKASGANTVIETKQNQNQKTPAQTDTNFADELKDLGKKDSPEASEKLQTALPQEEGLQNENIPEQVNIQAKPEQLQVVNMKVQDNNMELGIQSNPALNESFEYTSPNDNTVQNEFMQVQEDKNIDFSDQNNSEVLNEFTQVKEDEPIETTQIQENTVQSSVENAIENLNDILSELNQPEDNIPVDVKDIPKNTDKEEVIPVTTNDDKQDDEGTDVINNDFNIDNKDKLPQMTLNMNFSGDGQPFSSFMQNENNNNPSQEPKLSSSAKDLAEEAEILSTMAENIAIANKAEINAQPVESTEKTIIKEDGIKKIDTKTNMVKEVIVKYDTVVMNEADVQVFADLVDGKDVNLHNISADNVQKSVHVSKTLSDMLAKAMDDNKPIRIEFDNGISVIIKISRDGRLSADFLPSTQVAEAYLKENLPLLKQRFDEQNLDYDELNQRERRNPDREQNRKKGRENE